MARRAELHARGLKDAHIAEQMGIKRAYFSQVVNGLNVSDTVIDRMCSSFSMTFPAVEQVADHQTPEGMTMVNKELFDQLVLQAQVNTKLLNAVLDKLEKYAPQPQAQ